MGAHMDWLLDRLAHLTLHHAIPGTDVTKNEWGWRERMHVWGLERCGMRHWDDPRCWEPFEGE